MQKALVLSEVGQPLVEVNRPIPQPGPGELLVKLTSVGQNKVNPHDQKSRDRGLFISSTPYIPAHDLAGEIIALGPGPSRFTPGQHIFAQSRLPLNGALNDFNGLQQYALVDAKYAAPVADTHLSDDEAATMPVNAATGFVVFFHASGFGLPLDHTVDHSRSQLVVIGGATNCGRLAIQLARWLGFGVIVAVAGPGAHDELRELGATHVVDRHAGDTEVLARVKAIVGDELVYALDAFNYGPRQELGVAVLSDSRRGTLVTLAPAVGEIDAARVGEKRAGYERRFIRGSCAVHPDEFTGLFWERIAGWLREGVLRPSTYRVIDGLDADAINAALDEYREGKGMKVQVHPNVNVE
ncbi:zinc-binding alcohol dehydrogenase family protein [Aspergillus clavatus NRRL 1]|uniref:Alcohol dehydrogenase, zinc-containing, putative n=1 Tax=Aspergillus clavatus (strain ATCC 1007 / CBS 513.65 / DSM 816 / NCTC 3887 / NRRL 1 / QM 1276 / 107) TaxID=344612 RepID=A1CAX8_ASPCL|nr:alcohol dehydrogenase, zinc-containing, putative [Aspergillus clavatus NRRL 1]EAW12896.1 alcohol dehydrogenase, zinc-containing, putative [Aspergillus clavatus NRRL 1]